MTRLFGHRCPRAVRVERGRHGVQIGRRRAVRVGRTRGPVQAVPEFVHGHVPLVGEGRDRPVGVPSVAVRAQERVHRVFQELGQGTSVARGGDRCGGAAAEEVGSVGGGGGRLVLRGGLLSLPVGWGKGSQVRPG
jgi:hypothetical protein